MVAITYLIGIAAVILAIKKTKYSDKIISGILAFLWLWSGIVLLMIFLGPIDYRNYFGGALWIIQSILFFIFGVVKPSLSFKFERDLYSIVGAIMIIYGLIFYPIIGFLSGHGYPGGPIFGVACCPVCIFTFGMFLWINKKVPIFIAVIPLLWSLTGIIAATQYGVWPDYGEIIIGITGFIMILHRNAKKTLKRW
ncbi:MAG: hypothetical protein KAU17_12260, partial [Spirochaetales bacterium]|nr:hypothetical protein [Spirochaetales bacterium]